FQARIVGGVEPYDAASPAESGDTEFGGVCLVLLSPRGRGIEIRYHLLVRNFGDHVLDDLAEILVLADIALPRVHLRRDREVTGLGKTAAEILDVFVDAEDLLNHQDSRERPAFGGHGPVAGDLAVAG